MSNRIEFYGYNAASSMRLRRAVAVSCVVHVVLISFLSMAGYKHRFVMPETYSVRFIPYPKGEPQKQENTTLPQAEEKGPPQPAKPEAKPEPKPEAKPEPKKPEPKPEPKKPEPKPEPKKPEPKPEPKKPEAKKPEPKPEPKPKKPETKKPEAKKPESKAEGKAQASSAASAASRPSPKTAREAPPGTPAGTREGNDAYMYENAPMQTGISMPEGLPTVLDGWARLVQVKVEKNWQVPAGLSLGDKGNQATVSFWVDRQGNLLAKPEVVKEAADRELGESGVRAIMLAAPLPPLPDDFKSMEQEVIYVFTLAE